MKALSLLSLVAALAIGGYLLRAQVGGGPGGSGERLQAAEETASAQVAAANLRGAARALDAAHAAGGTYAGARLDGFGVRLVRADSTSYCLEAGAGSGVFHLRGPGGTPAAGRCL